MKVKEVMHEGVKWAESDTTLAEIARMMRDTDVGVIPILENDMLSGMITDRDIIIRAAAENMDMQSATAKDIMTDETIWSYEDADVDEVANLMKQKRIRRIPVVNSDKRLAGLVSVGDITRASEDMAGDALRDLSAVGD